MLRKFPVVTTIDTPPHLAVGWCDMNEDVGLLEIRVGNRKVKIHVGNADVDTLARSLVCAIAKGNFPPE